MKGGLPLVGACAMLASACGGNKTTYNAAEVQPFATDSVCWTDTIADGGCKAIAKIAGQYPMEGNPILIDSVRAWIAHNLEFAGYTSEPLFTPAETERANGNLLVQTAGRAMLGRAAADFAEFKKDSISINYEYSYNFIPAFHSDSLLTYAFTSYVYLGGAHGGSTGYGQTFDMNTGEQLTFDNSFLPEKRAELIELIKAGLWKQYFTNPASGESGAATLKEALLIDPDTLPLPACPPEFFKDGIAITYQQYEIACYAAGMPSCILTYDEVRPLLTEKAARLIP